MFRKEVAAKPLMIWILSAVTAPVVQMLAGYDWKLIVIVGVLSAVLVCLGLWCSCQWPAWISVMQAAWLIVVLAECLHDCGCSWPMAEAGGIIPLVLLVLAMWSAQKGSVVAARMAGILLLLMCVGYGLVLGSGLVQVRGDWIGSQEQVPLALAVFVFLLPGAAVCIPKHRAGKWSLLLFATPVFGLLATVVTCGSIHPERDLDCYAFYEMCRSLSLLGLAERFEALVCALVTVGWFSLLSFLLSCMGSQSQKISAGSGAQGVWIGAALAAGIYLVNLHMDPVILAVGSVIFWALIPLVSQGIGVAKNWIKK